MANRVVRVTVATATLALAASAAPAAARPPLNASHSFVSVSGYIDSVSGCSENTRTGPDQTFTKIGSLWFQNGQLFGDLNFGGFDTTDFTGTLADDGSFSLTGADHTFPSDTDTFNGHIDPQGNIDRGELIFPYLEKCIYHGTITSGSVDLPSAITPKAQAELDDAAKRLGAASSPASQAKVWESVSPGLTSYEEVVPGLTLTRELISMQVEGSRAATLAQTAIKQAARSPEAAATTLVRADAHLAKSVPSNTALLYETASGAKRLTTTGVDTIKKLEKQDAVVLQAIGEGAKFIKTNISLKKLHDRDENSIGQFAEDALDHVPGELIPSLSGPTGVAFREQLNWTQKMANATTQGLDVVLHQIETGKRDPKRLAAVTSRLNTLAKEGPWTRSTFIDTAKKYVEKLPYVGPVAKAIWG